MCSEIERGGLLKMVMPGSYGHKKTRQAEHLSNCRPATGLMPPEDSLRTAERFENTR